MLEIAFLHPPTGTPTLLASILIFLTLLNTALAGSEPQIDPPKPTPTVQSPVEETAEVDVNRLIRQAILRIKQQDYEGARILLKEVENLQQGEFENTLYLTASSWHEQGEHSIAELLYKHILTEWPNGSLKADVKFRLARLYASDKRYADATLLLDEILASEPLNSVDRQRVELTQIAWFLLDSPSKKQERLARKRIKSTDVKNHSFELAQLHAALASVAIEKMLNHPFDGGQRKLIRNHRRRDKLFVAAKIHLKQAIPLKQPEWVARILLRISEGLETTGDDLKRAAVPSKLSSDQQEIYRQTLDTYILKTWKNANIFLSECVHLTERLGLDKSLQTEARERQSALQTKLELTL